MNRIEQGEIAKEWLRTVVNESGISRPELAERVGVDQKTIKTMAGPKPALAGLTMLLLLRELGALVENPIPASSLEQRLRELEATVERQGEATTKSVDALAREVRALKPKRGLQDDPATGTDP